MAGGSGQLIGVLGGGQLGRMLALAGIRLGHRFRFLDPDPSCPASAVGEVVTAAFDDDAAVDRFCDGLDAATFEFENVPLRTVERVARRVRTSPGAQALAVAQDRVAEKRFFRDHGIRVQAFEAVDDAASLAAACGRVGVPGVLKSRRMGYDGKGQAVVRSPVDVAEAWRRVGGVPAIYEAFVDFRAELSVIGVRSAEGEVRTWAPGVNVHRGGILARTVVPADAAGVGAEHVLAAERAVRDAMSALGYVGVLAIEFFVTDEGLVANEMAPRVHNSGHWTQDGAVTCQFENHVRAVAGQPLGCTDRRGPSAMVNLVGDVPPVDALLSVPGARLHLYGKAPRPGRKLGHVNLCAADTVVRDAQVRVVEALVAESGR